MRKLLFIAALLFSTKAYSQSGTSFVADVRFSSCTYGVAMISSNTATDVLAGVLNGKMTDATYIELYNSSSTVNVGFDSAVSSKTITGNRYGRQIVKGSDTSNPMVLRVLPGKIAIYATSQDIAPTTPLGVIQCR